MLTNKVTFPGGKSCELRGSKAVVLSTSRDTETHVYGGGGGGQIIGGAGRINDITIKSKVIEHFRIWIRYRHNNREQEIDIGDSPLTCREGHEVYIFEGRSPRTSEQYEMIGIRNETTNISYFMPDVVTIMRRLGLIKQAARMGILIFLLLWLSFWMLSGYMLSQSKGGESTWVMALLFLLVVVPLLPAFLLGVVNGYLHRLWKKSAAPVEKKLNDELRALAGALRQSGA